jgi:hypothetical protein
MASSLDQLVRPYFLAPVFKYEEVFILHTSHFTLQMMCFESVIAFLTCKFQLFLKLSLLTNNLYLAGCSVSFFSSFLSIFSLR